MYRSRPSAWLRVLGMFYAGSIVAQLAAALAISPNLVLLTSWYVLAGFVVACCLGLVFLIARQRP
ncbi:MAG TPA: hypothetical protein VNA22_04470 [Pyrinomonadaceae bacterium]|nr:hypothetical protein [Pyrinomonadaceae bacterium]